MKIQKRAFRFALIVCVALLGASRAARAQELSATLEVTADAIQPAGFPIQFNLKMTNTGNQSIIYGASYGGNMPAGDKFRAILTGKDVYDPWVSCWNVMDGGGSHWALEIQAGKTIRFPLFLPALAPGEYRIAIHSPWNGYINGDKVETSWPEMRPATALKITIVNDDALRGKARDAMIAGIRADDHFIRNNATHFAPPDVIRVLLEDLTSDNLKNAESAGKALALMNASKDLPYSYQQAMLPSGARKAVFEALEKRLRLPIDKAAANAIRPLLTLGFHLERSAMLPSLLELARGDLPELLPDAASFLTHYPSPATKQVLLSLLASQDAATHRNALFALSKQGQTEALAPLLQMIAAKEKGYESAYRYLAKYIRDPRVRPVLEQAVKSENNSERFWAQCALSDIARNAKPQQ